MLNYTLYPEFVNVVFVIYCPRGLLKNVNHSDKKTPKGELMTNTILKRTSVETKIKLVTQMLLTLWVELICTVTSVMLTH